MEKRRFVSSIQGASSMKNVFTVCLALAFSSVLMAQSGSKPSDQSSQTGTSSTSSSPTSATSGQGQTMSGKVSSDGKTFTDDKTSKSHSVTNPDSLKGYGNQHVVVLVQQDPNTGAVTITAVQPPQ
jgi:hypothetical protein